MAWEYTRNALAGLAEVPIAPLQLLSVPRALRRLITGEEQPGPENSWVARNIEPLTEGYTGVVNEALGIARTPTFTNEPGQALFRIAGGAMPVPIAAPQLATGLGRVLSNIAEVATPLSFTGRATTTPGRVAIHASNIAVPAAITPPIEAAVNVPQTQEHTFKVTNEDGSSYNVTDYVPNNEPPNAARRFGDTVAETVREHPVASGALAGGTLLALAGANSAMRTARLAREQLAASDIVGPVRPQVPVEAEVAGAFGRAADTAVTNLADAGNTAKSFLDAATAPGSVERTVVRSNLELAQNEVSKQGIYQTIADNGILEGPRGTRVSESLSSIIDDAARLSEQDPTFMRRLDETIAIRNEIDNRKYAMLRGKWHTELEPNIDPATGLPIRLAPQGNQTQGYISYRIKSITEPRANLWPHSFGDLNAREAALSADPAVAAVATRYRKLMDDFAGWLMDNGAITPAERGKFANANPNFMHQLDPLNPKSALNVRRRAHKSGLEENADPMVAASEYMRSMVNFVIENNARRSFVETIDAAQQGSRIKTLFADLIGKKITKERNPYHRELDEVTSTRHPTIKYRDANGKRIEVEIKNAEVARALEFQPRLASTLLGGDLRKVVQMATTGVLAAVGGTPFALRNVLMSSVFGMVSRKPGTSFGLLDQMAQAVSGAVTGKRIGVRLDPTIIPAALGTAVADTVMVLGREAANGLSLMARRYPSLTPFAPQLEAASKKLMQMYHSSTYFDQQRAGAGRVGNLGTADYDVNKRLSIAQSSLLADRMRDVGDPRTVGEYLREVSRQTTPIALRKAWALATEIYDIVGNSPNSLYYKQNIGRTRRELTAAGVVQPEATARYVTGTDTRQLTGDPAQIGAWMKGKGQAGYRTPGDLFYRAMEATPYANVSVQALARMGRAIKENPGSAIATLVTMGTMGAVLPLVYADHLDDERVANGQQRIYVPHMLGMETWRAVSGIPVYIQGLLPDQAAFMAMDQQVMLPLVAIREAVAHMFGYYQDPERDPNAAMSRRAMREAGINQSWDRIGAAVGRAINPFDQVAPAIRLGAIFANIQLPDSWSGVIDRGGASTYSTRSFSGYDNTRVRDGVLTKRMEDALRAVAGTVGATLATAIDRFNFGYQDQRGALAQAGQAVTTASRDRLAETGPLWNQHARVGASDVIANMVNERADAIKRIASNNTGLNMPGTVGAGRSAELSDLGGRVGVDPEMRQLLLTVTTAAERRIKPLEEQRSELRDKQLDVERSTLLPPEQRRLQQNNLAYDIRELNRQILDRYTELEDDLSTRFQRRIRLNGINPRRGLDQFPPLQAGATP